MFARLITGAASRGGGERLSRSREGMPHAHSHRGGLESGQSSGGAERRSFDFMRTISGSGSENLQREAGDHPRSTISQDDHSDVMREHFRARRETDSHSVSEVSHHPSRVSGPSETSQSYQDERSHPESGDDYDDRSEGSSVSSYNRSETQSIFDHDDRSEISSVSNYGDEVHTNEVNSNNAQHENTGTDNTERRVENWLEDVYPEANDYQKHLWDGRNRLRKNREVAEENEQKLRAALKKMANFFKGDPTTQQMNNLIIPMAAGSLEQVESKMAPNPRE